MSRGKCRARPWPSATSACGPVNACQTELSSTWLMRVPALLDTCLSSKAFSVLAGFGLCRRPNVSAAMLDINECEQARVRRDRRFDGMFFSGVWTTRIYCRPVCPVKPAKAANVTFYPSAAAAELAGFRPCLRCRPEAAPFSPAWMGTRTTVERALRLIGDGALDDGNVEALADRLGIGSRHLSRLFQTTPGRKPGAGRSNHPRAAGKAASRRDRSHDVGDCRARRFRQLASVQHRVCRSISTAANGDQARSQPKQSVMSAPRDSRLAGRDSARKSSALGKTTRPTRWTGASNSRLSVAIEPVTFLR